jgi:hypothetical protein
MITTYAHDYRNEVGEIWRSYHRPSNGRRFLNAFSRNVTCAPRGTRSRVALRLFEWASISTNPFHYLFVFGGVNRIIAPISVQTFDTASIH